MTDSPDKRTPDGGFKPETLSAQGLGRVDAVTRAVVPPIHPSTTFVRDADGEYRSGRGYTRADNPSYDLPEDLLSKLEGGASSLLFSSGMAAAAAVFQSLLPGDHVIAPRMMYWTLRKWISDFPVSWGLSVDFVDMGDLAAVRTAIRPGKTRLIWTETPANPTWEICDIRALADIAHTAGARLAVDSTVATPVITRPIEHGADFVVHSASKYLNGHSDVLAGAVVGANRDGLWQRIRSWQRDGGAVLGPFEAWLLQRGMRTLFVRVERASQSAAMIAAHFHHHPKIREVLYPGLPSHPGHEIAARQMTRGFGGMLSLRIRGGVEAAVAGAANVTLFKRATSLGGVESLIEHRASIEGPASSVPDDLLRLSVGLEDPNDLIWDIEQALDQMGSIRPSPPTAALASAPLPDSREEAPLAAAAPAAITLSAIETTLDTIIRPVVLSRGGNVRLLGYEDGCVKLEMSGSPGAAKPIEEWIRDALGLRLSAVARVEILPASGGVAGTASGNPAVRAAQCVLDEQVNGALSHHGGRVVARSATNERIGLEFQGRCQGCAMAEVTLRQARFQPRLSRCCFSPEGA